MTNKPIDLSIVIPVYFNEGSLTLTLQLLQEHIFQNRANLRAEVMFIDDGSGDGSYAEMLALHKQFPDLVKIIKLTRNFGQVSAITAGLSYMQGECVVIMSADNQDPVELINQMLDAHDNENYDIVICTRESREESFYRQLTSRVFYNLIRKLSFEQMPAGGFDYVLLSRRVVAQLLRNQEATPFFQGQILWTGFRTKFIGYNRQERKIGKSRWTFRKKVTYLLDGVIAYSYFPIRLMSILGLLMAFVGFLYALLIVVVRLFWELPVEGWAPLMVAVLIMGGLQMVMLGVIGEYLWRTLAQTRNRDPFVIEAMHGELTHRPVHETTTAGNSLLLGDQLPIYADPHDE